MSKDDINNTMRSEGVDGVLRRHDNARKFSAAPADNTTHRQGKALSFRQHRDGNANAPRYLIKKLLPETGTALLSGQWGSFKTFVAVAVSAAVATGDAFIGHSIKRRGAVLFFAMEGAGDLSSRIDAFSIAEHGNDRLPIFYTDHEIELLDPLSVDDIIVTVSLVDEKAKELYKLPLALIVIDTLTAAAGYARAGDENDASVTQRVMNALAEISRATGALVLALDHHGKTAEAGTRGSSAKEAAADTVLAILADRSTAGKMTNMRLVVRKQRTGQAGAEFPFRTKIVELGVDDDDEPFHSLAIEFFEPEGQPISQSESGWTRSLSALRRILMSMLADAGENIRPFHDGPEVRAVRSKIVRDEFYRQFAGGEDDQKKKSEAQRKAFNRALKAAQEKGLLGIREVDGVQWLWLLASSQGGTGGTVTPL
jgi:hypothetical protein